MKKALILFLLLFIPNYVHAEYQLVDKNQSGLIGSPTKPFRKIYLGSQTPIVFEGSITNDYKTTIIVEEPTGNRTITIPDVPNITGTETFALTGKVNAANSVWFVDNGIKAEGSTADAFETTLSFNNPTQNNTLYVPDKIGIGTLSTNAGTGSAKIINVLTGTTTLTIADAGKINTCDVDGTTVTLPLASTCPGCSFTLLCTGGFNTTQLKLRPISPLYGDVVYYNGSVVAILTYYGSSGGEGVTATLFKSNQNYGAFITVISNGNSYYITGSASKWTNN